MQTENSNRNLCQKNARKSNRNLCQKLIELCKLKTVTETCGKN